MSENIKSVADYIVGIYGDNAIDVFHKFEEHKVTSDWHNKVHKEHIYIGLYSGLIAIKFVAGKKEKWYEAGKKMKAIGYNPNDGGFLYRLPCDCKINTSYSITELQNAMFQNGLIEDFSPLYFDLNDIDDIVRFAFDLHTSGIELAVANAGNIGINPRQ